MSKPVPVELAVKPLYDHVTQDCYRAGASWVTARDFVVDPTLQLKHEPFLLDQTLYTIKDNEPLGTAYCAETGTIHKHT